MAYNLSYILRTLLTAQATYLLLIFYFHLRKVFLTPIAYILNQSYLIQHPDMLYPSVIAPAQNRTIHTFFPNEQLHAYLKSEGMLTSRRSRHWVQANEVASQMIEEVLPLRAIVIDGEVAGPQIRQGIMLMQGNSLVYVGEEIGRWPTQDNLITTISVNMQTGNSFPLFVPFHLINTTDVRDDSPNPPLRSPLPLPEALHHAEALQRMIFLQTLPPPAPYNV